METYNRTHQRDSEGKPLKDISQTRLYSIWSTMHQRCYNPKSKVYQYYGGKGITVCREWNRDNVNGFDNFRQWAIQNGYTENLTIDRIDPNRNYEPDNCQWADMKTQLRNRSYNHPITVNGVEYGTIAEAVESLHREADYKTIQSRIYHHGYTPDQAFSEPIEPSEPIKVHFNGTEYASIAEACRALNLNYNAVKCYKRKHHTTAEEAVLHYLKP